jgi:hypothetical protein
MGRYPTHNPQVTNDHPWPMHLCAKRPLWGLHWYAKYLLQGPSHCPVGLGTRLHRASRPVRALPWGDASWFTPDKGLLSGPYYSYCSLFCCCCQQQRSKQLCTLHLFFRSRHACSCCLWRALNPASASSRISRVGVRKPCSRLLLLPVVAVVVVVVLLLLMAVSSFET